MTLFQSDNTITKCPRCNGSLYHRLGYASCLNCGHEPPRLSKEIKDEVTKSMGAKRIGGTRVNRHISGY